MSSPVEKLESLLARVQRNRMQPRPSPAVEREDVSGATAATPAVESMPSEVPKAGNAPARESIASRTPLERALESQTSRASLRPSASPLELDMPETPVSSFPPASFADPGEPEISIEEPFPDEEPTGALPKIAEPLAAEPIEAKPPVVSAPIARTKGEAPIVSETFGTLLARTLSLRPR